MHKWNAIKDFIEIQDKITRIFESAFPHFRSAEAEIQNYWSPAVDIYEDKESYILWIDLPGVEKDDINLKVEENSLIIKGERKSPADTEKQNYLKAERQMGNFYRSFTLPRHIDIEAIQAKYDNGVLQLKIPKKSEVKSKEIKINLE